MHSSKTKDSVPWFLYNTYKNTLIIRPQSTCSWAPHTGSAHEMFVVSLFSLCQMIHTHTLSSPYLLSHLRKCNSILPVAQAKTFGITIISHIQYQSILQIYPENEHFSPSTLQAIIISCLDCNCLLTGVPVSTLSS